MGYMTDYDLDYVSDELIGEALLETLDSVTGYDWPDSLELYDVKWYDALDNMKVISKKFPTTLFTLDGKGEESGDIWRAYFKGGKMQYCKAKTTFDDFFESMLKP